MSEPTPVLPLAGSTLTFQYLLGNITAILNETLPNYTMPSATIFPLVDADTEGFAVLAGVCVGIVLVIVFWVIWRTSLSVPVRAMPANSKKWQGAAQPRGGDGEHPDDDEKGSQNGASGGDDDDFDQGNGHRDDDDFGADSWQSRADVIGMAGRSSAYRGQQQQQHSRHASRTSYGSSGGNNNRHNRPDSDLNNNNDGGNVNNSSIVSRHGGAPSTTAATRRTASAGSGGDHSRWSKNASRGSNRQDDGDDDPFSRGDGWRQQRDRATRVPGRDGN